MVGGGGAAGEVPAGEACADSLQPANRAGVELERAVPLDAVLANMSPAFTADTRRLQESLQRRTADRELLDELAAGDFTGRRYQRFEEELAAYAMSVLRGWMHSGYVFKLTAARGFALNPSDAELDELFRDSDVREELAIMTVALALPRFKKKALVGGGWRYEGGASISTYFMGSCLYVFPNELRKRRVQRRRWHLQDHGDPALAAPRTDKTNDPATITTGNAFVREHLEQVDSRTRAILAATLDGYSQEEIVEMLDETSVRAVEGVVHRWRKKTKSKQLRGGSGA
jgi:DNA-directed RNA polymerase specialized sigma24 family protein